MSGDHLECLQKISLFSLFEIFGLDQYGGSTDQHCCQAWLKIYIIVQRQLGRVALQDAINELPCTTGVGDPDGTDRLAGKLDGLAVEKLKSSFTHILICQFLENFARVWSGNAQHTYVFCHICNVNVISTLCNFSFYPPVASANPQSKEPLVHLQTRQILWALQICELPLDVATWHKKKLHSLFLNCGRELITVKE